MGWTRNNAAAAASQSTSTIRTATNKSNSNNKSKNGNIVFIASTHSTISSSSLLFLFTHVISKGIHFFKAANIKKTLFYFNCAMLVGFGFLVLKSFEYYEKLEAGLHMDYNSFFRFYWLLTGFHFIHVLVGLVILLVITFSIKKKQTEASFEDIEASASFWHMCDLIWLLLFPVLYLLF